MDYMVVRLLLLNASLILLGCYDSQEVSEERSKAVYFGMQPTKDATLLAPKIIGSALDEYNGTFSPLGDEFFFTTNTPGKGIICFATMLDDDAWTSATIAPFSGVYSEYDPIFSPDGSRLYFTSERPTSGGGEDGSTHIWYVEKNETGWNEQPTLVDLKMTGVYYSSLTNSGTLYFNHWNSGDIYRAEEVDGSYRIDTLSKIINSANGEGDPFISPNGDYLIYRGYENSLGNGDLYISYQTDGDWSAPINLGEPINSKHHEMCPYVTIDGKFFVFASSRLASDYGEALPLDDIRNKFTSSDNGNLNIYYISADFIEDLREKI